jgi:hypothetical protein
LGWALVVAAMIATGCGSGASVGSNHPDTSVAAAAAPTEQTTTFSTTSVSQARERHSGYRHCDPNVRARVTNTTCAFALNTFYEFYVHGESASLRVWSPAAHRSFATRCSAGPTVTCRASDGGAVTFPRSAVYSYNDQLAKAYAASSELGPSSAGSATTTTASSSASSPDDASASDPSGSSQTRTRVCYPGIYLRAVVLPATSIPATTLPAFDLGGTHYPAQHLPAQHISGARIPAQHIGRTCLDAPVAFALPKTTLLSTDGYRNIDGDYSPQLTARYWDSAGPSVDVPDPTAPGFGETDAAGFPKNQYVRPYMRSDGTPVSGYWRNSPSDGLATCSIVSC